MSVKNHGRPPIVVVQQPLLVPGSQNMAAPKDRRGRSTRSTGDGGTKPIGRSDGEVVSGNGVSKEAAVTISSVFYSWSLKPTRHVPASVILFNFGAMHSSFWVGSVVCENESLRTSIALADHPKTV